MSNEAEEGGTKLRWADGLPPVDSAHSGKYIRSRCILQQITRHSGTDGSHELFFVRLHANQDDLKASGRSILGSKTCRKAAGLEGIAHQDVALSLKNAQRCFVGGRGLADDKKVGPLSEESNQGFPQEAILNQQERANRRNGDAIINVRHKLRTEHTAKNEGRANETKAWPST